MALIVPSSLYGIDAGLHALSFSLGFNAIKIKDGFIQTDLFSKDTDKHLYLHVTSSHPNLVKIAIPYRLGIRAKRICSEDEDDSVRRTEIKTHLRKRGCTNDMVEKQLQKRGQS